MSDPIDQNDLIGCLKVGAYYYGFDPTEVPVIDRMLGAVCRAGKMYHHTDMWTGDPYVRRQPTDEPTDEPTPVDVIQTAANEAAEEIIKLRKAIPPANVMRGLKLLGQHYENDGHDWSGPTTEWDDVDAALGWLEGQSP